MGEGVEGAGGCTWSVASCAADPVLEAGVDTEEMEAVRWLEKALSRRARGVTGGQRWTVDQRLDAQVGR